MTTPPTFRSLCADLVAALDSYLMMDGRDETLIAERVARLMEARRKCVEAVNAKPATPPRDFMAQEKAWFDALEARP